MMSYKKVQHLTHYELSHKNCMRIKQNTINKRNTNGQYGGPPNIEQPLVVQKKKPEKDWK